MVLTSFTAGTLAESAKVNVNFAHNLTYASTTTLSYTPGSATTKNIIICKGYFAQTTTEMSTTITLNSSVDGVLDTVLIYENGSTTSTRAIPFSLTFAGTMTATAHTLTINKTGALGSINNAKITAMEFL